MINRSINICLPKRTCWSGKGNRMEWKNLIFEGREEIGIITINRPGKLNALNKEMLLELKDIIKGGRSDEKMRVVIITGSGEKAFGAGADLNEIAALGLPDAFAFSRAASCQKPSIERNDSSKWMEGGASKPGKDWKEKS